MAFGSVNYQRVQSSEEDLLEEDLPPTVVSTRGTDERGRWNHIENLDEFFTRIYEYHQQYGFTCMVLSEFFKLVQYIFIVVFSTFLIVCVDYTHLFKNDDPKWEEAIHFERLKRMPTGLAVFLIVGLVFWILKLFQVVLMLCKAFQIRNFYSNVLHIVDSDLQNMQWHDVQKKVIEAQKIHHMCVHKSELTELDIYHRILRHKNYLIAMQNKAVIPCIYKFPFLGHRTFLTQGLKYNLKLILFTGSGAPFETNWKLKNEYKDVSNRRELAARLSKRILLFGIANLALCPFILLYEVLHSFFKYAEMIKRSPDFFGARRWAPYGRLYLRHLNELDHEFQARLNKAYEPSTKYMNSFTSPLVAILAKNVAFFGGALLSVLLVFSFYDQDVLKATNVISIMASLGLIIKACSSFIADENFVWCPETLMKQVLTFTHYIPDHWKGKAHTSEVRKQFARLFQYKFIYLAEELLSPLLTPFILIFGIRCRAQSIVDFFRNFTVEVTGVGDVCSFAQLDVRKHGNPEWLSVDTSEINQFEQGENGKTELSLLHFSMKNPTWKPTIGGETFIATIKEQAMRESLTMSGSLPFQSGSGETVAGEQSRDLTSLAGPYHPSLNTLDSDQPNSLMNTSIMYLHQLRDQTRTASGSSADSNPRFENIYPSLRQPWPGYTDGTDEEEDNQQPRPEDVESSHDPTKDETKF